MSYGKVIKQSSAPRKPKFVAGNSQEAPNLRVHAASDSDELRRIPVFVVIPPRLLLLDIAGPLEVLRQANRVQRATRFEVRYIGPCSSLQTSIGITLAEIEPL